MSNIPVPPEVPHILDYYPAPMDKFKGIVSIPHSGETITDEFRPFLGNDQKALDQDLDYRVDELVDIDLLVANGISVTKSKIHRVTVDLNRSEDLAVFAWKKNSHGVEIVTKEINEKQREHFLLKYYYPYYELLKAQILELSKRSSDPVAFVDLHSMPSRPTAYHMKQNPNQKEDRPDFCVSNVSGKTCGQDYIDFVTTRMDDLNYLTTQNDPYFGGHVTRWVGENFNTNVIQIETNRSIYMDEQKQELFPDRVKKIREDLTPILLDLFAKFGTKN